MTKLVKKIKVTTTIQVITGLHIGGSSESVEIGGVDKSVIKLAMRKNQPYIPGSSLKGKMRSLLEQIHGNATLGGSEKVNNLFGTAKGTANSKKEAQGKREEKDSSSPSKIIFRDSYLNEKSVIELEGNDFLDMPYTELKAENKIDRKKGTADSPRFFERIPAGVSFDVEMILNIWDTDNEEDMKDLLEEGITALENDYLGGNGSRGYGQIQFSELIYDDIEFCNSLNNK